MPRKTNKFFDLTQLYLNGKPTLRRNGKFIHDARLQGSDGVFSEKLNEEVLKFGLKKTVPCFIRSDGFLNS